MFMLSCASAVHSLYAFDTLCSLTRCVSLFPLFLFLVFEAAIYANKDVYCFMGYISALTYHLFTYYSVLVCSWASGEVADRQAMEQTDTRRDGQRSQTRSVCLTVCLTSLTIIIIILFIVAR